MSKRIIITILLCGGLYLLGNGRVSLWDRDEPRYAQASRQMLQSGDWVVPKLLDEPRIKKPPMIYWCQAASMAVFQRLMPDAGRSPEEQMQRDAAAARLPSSIAVVLTMLLMALVLVCIVGEERAFWTVLVFGTSGLVIMAAKMCLTDGVLLLFVTASQFCIYAMYQKRGSWGVVIAFGVSTGLGLLTKGPVVLGINLTTVIVLELMRVLDARIAKRKEPRGFDVVTQAKEGPHPSPLPEYRARESEQSQATVELAEASPPMGGTSVVAKVLLCIAIIFAIGLPWVIVMWQRMSSAAGPGENGFWLIIKHEIFDRMTSPLEQHKGPPGYYLLFFFATFFPWCLLLPTAIKLAWQNRREPLTRFAFAAVVGPWIMFECIATKLPHYVLPCFPFLAFLTAQAIVGGIRNQHQEWNNRGWKIAVGVWSLAVIALGIAPWLAAMKRFGFDRLPYGAMAIVTLAAVFFAVLVFIRFAQQKIASAAYSMAAAMLELMALLFGTYLPSARFLHLSEEVGSYLQTIGATKLHEIEMIDYKEDSLPFYQGGTIRPQRLNPFLNKEPPENWPTYLVITREIWDKTSDSAKSHLQVLKTFHGLAYAAKGRVVDVMVVKKLN
jgi:4-amino-4-deoxy-L-arabinose transferase-like glycosyltransferase